MNELQIFKNNEFGNLRVVQKDNQTWFVAKDVCECLGLSNSRKALTRLDTDEKADVTLSDGRQNRNYATVNEYGLYALVLSSRKPEAHQFKRWVTHDILPTIRKHGAYMTPETIEKTLTDPDFIIRLATELKNEKQARIKAEETIIQNRPKVLFADAVSDSNSSILVGDLAKILRGNGVNIGQKRLFSWMRENGFLMKGTESRNMPTQRAMEMGLFKVKEGTYINGDGVNVTTKTTKVTGKGQQYFINKFLGN
jgi:Prophage antirepressor|nr:MAG TPA: KilAC domain protein [Caudoviricetes sp.]